MNRSFKYGSSALIYSAIVACVLIAINLISTRHNLRFDLTDDGAYTLADQSVQVLNNLDEKITVYAFTREERRLSAKDLLQQYALITEKFSFKLVDLDKQPMIAKRFNATKYGTYYVETESGRKELAGGVDESAVTSAIVKATTTREKNVYVLKGHGERGIDDNEQQGWHSAKQALLESAYSVRELDWFKTGEIPKEADLLIIAGPRNDFQKEEIERLKEFLQLGKSILFALDPVDIPELGKYLETIGFKIIDDMILDPLSQKMGFDPLVATISSYVKHPVTEKLKAASFFLVARSIELVKTDLRNIEQKSIGTTNPNSWSETDLKSIDRGEPEYSGSDDIPGPRVVIGSSQWEVGADRSERKIGQAPLYAKVILAGDSDFASNSGIGLSANRDLFLNTVGWLVSEENRLSIRAKDINFRPILFTTDELSYILWASVPVMPTLVMIVGTIVWFRRKQV